MLETRVPPRRASVSGFWARPRPNPTSGHTQFEFFLPRAAAVKLTVADLLGRRVASLADGFFGAGRHAASWDGQSDGKRAPTGLYFIHYQTPHGSLVQRLVLTR